MRLATATVFALVTATPAVGAQGVAGSAGARLAAESPVPHTVCCAPGPRERTLDTVAQVASAFAVTLTIANATVNRNGESRALARLGIASGVVAVGIGLTLLQSEVGQPEVVAVSVASGMISLMTAAVSAHRGRTLSRVTPILPTGSNGRAGLSLTF